MIRIVAGQLGGRRIHAPAGLLTRPSSERLRESIFQHLLSAVLDHGFDNLRVLDLFAGSGALAFEAISRGAAHATLVEHNPTACQTILRNIHDLNLQHQAVLVRGKIPSILARLPGGPFHLVFADPPYDAGLLDPALDGLLGLPDLLDPDAVLVLEHRRNAGPNPRRDIDILSIRDAGDTQVTIARVRR